MHLVLPLKTRLSREDRFFDITHSRGLRGIQKVCRTVGVKIDDHFKGFLGYFGQD